MGVDGIGSGGPRVGGVPPGAVPDVAPVATEPTGAGAVAASAAPGSAALGRLERREIDLDGYLDARVDEAMGPLAGRLDSDRLAFVRGALREELAADPVLAELVRRATGRAPRPE